MQQDPLGYLSDCVKCEQFSKAIGLVVKQGERVTDWGCRSGVVRLRIPQQNAVHVFTVDDSAMIDIAGETMMRASQNCRATFIRGKSNQVELQQRVDVVVCDHVGYRDGKRTAQEVRLGLLRDHPEVFPSSREISDFVLRVLGRDIE